MPDVRNDTSVSDAKMQKDRQYWIEQMSGHRVSPGLNPDYPRPSVFAFDKGTFEVRLEGGVYRELNRLTANNPFLLYVILMASLKVYLSKRTGSASIAVGSPSRKKEGASISANALAIVDRIDDQAPFRQFLIAVR